ncbi:hypothetical protein GCM10018781_80490 [Kitasatospora indigofera]|uniref:Uncharacterized protein n=1 Tax=Kitasatospora indigofera TaxID=67307 RepID=A0A918YX99_9ACTN|nr:hypothetical protein [Kitasatospora indigofera]GHE27922.1 hypothetical protein GCM10018781_80490 [Kitasatospora indigofera]
MILVLLGLLILAVAAVVAVAGIFTNAGGAHELTNSFSVFGHQVTGSTGTLFLFGVIVGAVAMLGLGLLLTGARRSSRLGSAARHGLADSRRETAAVAQRRDDLVEQRDTARADATLAARERDGLAGERDDLASQRDDMSDQRDAIAQERAELMRGGSGAHERTAGTRVAPMPPNRDADPSQEDEPEPDGARGLHLFGHRPASR